MHHHGASTGVTRLPWNGRPFHPRSGGSAMYMSIAGVVSSSFLIMPLSRKLVRCDTVSKFTVAVPGQWVPAPA